MRLRLWRYAPVLLGGSLVLLMAAFLWVQRKIPEWSFIERLEWITYDWRVRLAGKNLGAAPDRFGVVTIDEKSLEEINRRQGFRWPLPRMLYGQVVKELKAQGATAVLFDIYFIDGDDPRTQPRVPLVNGTFISSDEYFAMQIQHAGNVCLMAPHREGAEGVTLPLELFRPKALAVGHGYRDADPDGVLRRFRPFLDDPSAGRIWHAGIVLAAVEMGLDLAKAEISVDHIVIPRRVGDKVKLPLDGEGKVLVNWSLPMERLTRQDLTAVLGSASRRAKGPEPKNIWKDKMVVVGATGLGGNVRDKGATPISEDDYLFSVNWNIARSLLAQQFVREPGWLVEVALLGLFTTLTGVVTWKLRAIFATGAIFVLASGYVAFVVWIFSRHRVHLPLVLPVIGAFLMTHVSLISFRMLLERSQRRRVRSLFGKMVSPTIMDLLLEYPDPAHGTQKRELTVLFADIRGFTNFTDQQKKLAEAEIIECGYNRAQTLECQDRHANQAMETVNLYLTAIVDAVKKYDGTLDKYIGDCVMAFWGAPLPNPRQAERAVRAAVAAQKEVARINAERVRQNSTTIQENTARLDRGERPLPLLTILEVGIGINTGTMIVGFMGSDRHLSNYTVFGHEANIASRLEGSARNSTILISEATFKAIEDLGAQASDIHFQKHETLSVKGIEDPISTYKVVFSVEK